MSFQYLDCSLKSPYCFIIITGIPAATTTIEPMEQIPIEYEPKPVPTDGDTGREPEKVAVLEREVSSEVWKWELVPQISNGLDFVYH